MRFIPEYPVYDTEGRLAEWCYRELSRLGGDIEEVTQYGLVAPVTSVSVDHTVQSYEAVILVDATSGNITITLPDADMRLITVKKTDASGNTVTLSTPGSETIDGAATNVLSSQYDVITVCSDQSNWYIV